jgi:integrase
MHWSGYPNKAAARAAGEHVSALLALAGSSAALRAQIGDMIRAGGRGGLPAVEDVARRLGLGLDPGSPAVTCGEWLTGWLASRRSLRRSTLRSYTQHVRTWLIPHLGEVPLERLTAMHISGMFAAIEAANAELARQRAGGRVLIEIEGDVRSQPRMVGPSTQRRILATLRSALNAAVKQRQLTYNPCQGVDLLPEKPAEQPRWTPAEAARFITCTAGDPLGLMFRLAVDHTILELDGPLTEDVPKTDAGVRRVYVDAETAALLRAHRRSQLAARLRAGDEWHDRGLVFCRFDGSPWRPSYVSRRFKVLAAQAGVPVVTLHQGGRHTANSLMRDAGVDQELRMRVVGHAGKDVNDRYTHTLAEAHLAAAEQTAALVRQAGSPS